MVRLENVSVSYGLGGGRVDAVKNVTLLIRPGESASLIGKSGSGKTTLLKTMGGLLKPNAGTCVVDGQDLYALSSDARCIFRREKIGFVLQDYDLIPELTVLENVAFPLMLTKKKIDREEIEALCRSVGIEKLLDRFPHEISGGECQRTAIARALVHRPHLLLCDEPTGNLDRENTKNILDLLFRIREMTGVALVIVTHDVEVAEITERKYRMIDGRLEERL